MDKPFTVRFDGPTVAVGPIRLDDIPERDRFEAQRAAHVHAARLRETGRRHDSMVLLNIATYATMGMQARLADEEPGTALMPNREPGQPEDRELIHDILRSLGRASTLSDRQREVWRRIEAAIDWDSAG